MPKTDSIDEILANIDIDSFITDYNSGGTNLHLQHKYNIRSQRSLQNLINSLINLKRIKRIEDRYVETSDFKKRQKDKSNKSGYTKNNNQNKVPLNGDNIFITNNKKEYIETDLLTDDSFHNIQKNDINVNKNHKCESNTRIEEIKDELFKYWNIGLPNFYICQILNINLLTLQKYKLKIGLKNKHFNSSISYYNQIKKIENKIIDLKIQKLIHENQQTMFIEEISRKLGFNENIIKDIVEDNVELKKCRLSFFLPDEEETQYVVQIFHAYAFSIIIYGDKRGLLLKLSEILKKILIKTYSIQTVK
jgi:hypothetical protein